PDLIRYVKADSVRLRQVIMNLLSNAVKFTEKGEIELKVKAERLKEKDDIAIFKFSVRDTGIGIAEKQQKKIFDSFSQADPSTTKKYGGTGLGLTISNRLLEKMGDKLHLYSEADSGSTFSFSIELEVFQELIVPKLRLKEIKNVLVVDDNEKNRHILKDMLTSIGIKANLSSNGMEVLEILKDGRKYDTVIIDYSLPFMNGLEVLKQIRKTLKISSDECQAILLVDSSENTEIFDKSRELQLSYILSKPVKSHELLETLKKIENKEEEDFSTVESISGKDKIEDSALSNERYNILIAEDNKINMELAVTFVSSLLPKATITKAFNGAAAVTLYKASNPDLIFMDIQMPEKDGYTTTKEIREIETKTGKNVTIVALTAGTVKGERDICLKAGMNDYLSKPFREDELVTILKKWLTKKDSNSKKQKTEVYKEKESKHFDKAMLLKRISNNKELFDYLIEIAKDDFKPLITQLKESIKTRDYENVRISSHSLKGASRNINFDILGDYADEVESLAIEKKEWSSIDKNVQLIDKEFEYLLGMLDKI
ncbi:response regulator, partial [Bacteroidota bacterium]